MLVVGLCVFVECSLFAFVFDSVILLYNLTYKRNICVFLAVSKCLVLCCVVVLLFRSYVRKMTIKVYAP